MVEVRTWDWTWAQTLSWLLSWTTSTLRILAEGDRRERRSAPCFTPQREIPNKETYLVPRFWSISILLAMGRTDWCANSGVATNLGRQLRLGMGREVEAGVPSSGTGIDYRFEHTAMVVVGGKARKIFRSSQKKKFSPSDRGRRRARWWQWR